MERIQRAYPTTPLVSVQSGLCSRPQFKTEERDTILHRIEELDELASPEMLAAIDEADASPSDQDLSADAVRQKVMAWAHSK